MLVCKGIDTRSKDWKMWYSFCQALIRGERQLLNQYSPRNVVEIPDKVTNGRPPGLSTHAKLVSEMELILHQSGRNVSEISKALGIGSFDTFYKYLAYAKRQQRKRGVV